MESQIIQKQCEQFLKSLGIPGFIVIGLQSNPENVDMVYSLNDMPLKGAVKGLTHTLNDLIGRL